MRITPYNVIDDTVTITMSSQNAAFPKSNLLDTYASMRAYFTGATDENIVFDAGSGETIDFNSVAIVNHNFTSSATVTVEANATDSWGSPSFEESMTYNEYMYYSFFSTTPSYRYARIRIQDATNTDVLKIGVIFIGEYVEYPAVNNTLEITDTNNGTSSIGLSGQAGGNPRYTGRSATVTMESITNAQRLVLREIVETNGAYIPYPMAIWTADFASEPPIYGIIEPSQRFRRTQIVWATSITLSEVF